jgi:hypothetical protein
MSNEFLVFSENVFEFIPNLVMYVLFGIGIYILITYVIDLHTKELIKSILNELKNK